MRAIRDVDDVRGVWSEQRGRRGGVSSHTIPRLSVLFPSTPTPTPTGAAATAGVSTASTTDAGAAVQQEEAALRKAVDAWQASLLVKGYAHQVSSPPVSAPSLSQP